MTRMVAGHRHGGTVLVLTGPSDPTADAVLVELGRRAARVVRLNLGDFPTCLRLAASTSRDGWAGRLWTDDAVVTLAEVRSVYYRRPTRFALPDGLSDGDAVFAAAEARLGLGGVLAALDARWVNEPARVARAEYKPLQLRVAANVGLSVPRTLVTNDHAAAVDFAAAVDGPVVCKTLSSLVLAEGGQPRITYTTVVDPAAIDPAAIAATAHLLQEQVPKAFDVRATMVGHESHAVAIHTASERGRADWRAAYDELQYAPIDVPADVRTGMARYLDDLGLSFAAFDFGVTAGGRWLMYEANPNGQWLWIAEQTGLPIAASIAELLTDGPAG
jgi:ATP-grasp ribosomal peptide maturase